MSTQTSLKELWSFQDGTDGLDFFNSAAIGPDGTSVLSGRVRGDWKYNSTRLTSQRSVAAKLDIGGKILWKWQDDTLRFQVRAAAVDGDGSVVLAGFWMFSGSTVFFTVRKLDSNGTFLWEYQDENSGDVVDVVQGIAIGDDGSVYCGGFSGAEIAGIFSSESDFYSTFSAFKLDKDGTLLWKEQEQVGYGDDNALLRVALGNDGSVAFAGFSGYEYYVVLREQETGSETWALEGDRAGTARGVATSDDGSVIVAVANDSDDSDDYYNHDLGFFVAKVDSNGTEIWSFQDNGTTTFDDGGYFSPRPYARVQDVAVLADGSIFCAGGTNGEWDGPNAGEEETWDMAAFILSSDGQEILWRYQGGSVGYDQATAVATAPDGKTILLAGYTGYNETDPERQDLKAVLFSTDPSATVPTPSPLVPSPPTPGPVGVDAPLTPILAPTPDAVELSIFEVPEQIAPEFAGMGVSTVAMALLVMGCCCWGGRTNKK